MSDSTQGRSTEDNLIATTITRVFRDERASVLATLIRQVGDFQLAEDAVQDAFTSAIASWGRDGIPRNPGAWITSAARRRAIDRLRRARSLSDRTERLAELVRLDQQEHPTVNKTSVIDDDRLRLIFTACHPALNLAARVALTLRVLGGLTTNEIARAFLVSEPTMGKRILRAKRKISAAHIPYQVPSRDELPHRLRGVLRVIYLIFNEGYAASEGESLIRNELCGEAIRLGRLLCELLPEEIETRGLLALMLLHNACQASRVDQAGQYVSLDAQDRSAWDQTQVQEGLQILKTTLQLRQPGEYQVQAAITALHLQASSTDTADWAQIAQLYGVLTKFNPSHVVELNRVAAVGFASGPETALKLLQPLLDDPALNDYQPLHATHADLLRRAGDPIGAAEAYKRAIALSSNAVERAELTRRLESLTAS